ncbi:MAG: serine/threonine-protein phosphatase, partial [Deltaproteobacteria bacterium]|nr:serine/threonine-protein phosphatase [Deltaproteobacteria bacterium]
TVDEGADVKPGDPASYLRYAISTASREIHDHAAADGSLKGMGTTSVCALFHKNLAYVANVGDSRVYRIRGGEILQLTKDHSLVGEQMRAGFLSQEDARGHRFKNIITRSVGFQKVVEADIDIRAIRAGDVYLLCSDGLSNMVLDQEMRDIVTNTPPKEACQRLIDIANERGGDDNVTVLLACVEVDKGDKRKPAGPDEPTLEAD